MTVSQLGDFISLTTNDGQVLSMPNADISVVSYGGFGAPPVTWFTKQGYHQHGETEVAWTLQKRPITLQMHYASAPNRGQYWKNRALLQDFLRHNRLGPMTLTIALSGLTSQLPIIFKNSGNTIVAFSMTTGTNQCFVSNVNGTDAYGRSPVFFVGQLIQIDQEQMIVSNVDAINGILTVYRAVNGTVAAIHNIGRAILGSLYPFSLNPVPAQRSIVVRADPGLTLPKDPNREANWNIDEEINLIAFNPIWQDTVVQSLAVAQAAQQNLVFPITFPITFGTNGLLLVATINYPGTWYAYPKITLTGPYNFCTILNVQTGAQIVMSVPLITGQQRIISTTPGQMSIVDQNGVNYFAELGPSSDLVDFNIRGNPEVPNGINTFNIIMNGFAAGSAASISYQNQYFAL